MEFNELEKLLYYMSFGSRVIADDVTLSFFDKDVAYTLSRNHEKDNLIYFDAYDLLFQREKLSVDIPIFYIQNFLTSFILVDKHLLVQKNYDPEHSKYLHELVHTFALTFEQQVNFSDYPELFSKIQILKEKEGLESSLDEKYTHQVSKILKI